jgi:dolichol-phosphate mannosyltransferase
LRFNIVGLAGFGVQLAVVYLLSHVESGFSRTVEVAAITALAVEAAILHNFFWHERWTWADRPAAGRDRLARLQRFHLTNGLVSIAGNVVIVAALAGLHPLAANAIAVLICSMVNFAAGDRVVFATRLRAAQSSPTYP